MSDEKLMRQEAIAIFELTKGFTTETKDNAMKSALKMAGYVMELTQSIPLTPTADSGEEEAIPYIPVRAEEGEFGILTPGTGKPVNPEELWGKPASGEIPGEVKSKNPQDILENYYGGNDPRTISEIIKAMWEFANSEVNQYLPRIGYLSKKLAIRNQELLSEQRKCEDLKYEIFTLKEALEESRNDAKVYQEWYKRSDANIAALTDQLSKVQEERNQYRKTLEYISANRLEAGMSDLLATSTLKKYPKQ
jgi:hypothetical protein